MSSFSCSCSCTVPAARLFAQQDSHRVVLLAQEGHEFCVIQSALESWTLINAILRSLVSTVMDFLPKTSACNFTEYLSAARGSGDLGRRRTTTLRRIWGTIHFCGWHSVFLCFWCGDDRFLPPTSPLYLYWYLWRGCGCKNGIWV